MVALKVCKLFGSVLCFFVILTVSVVRSKLDMKQLDSDIAAVHKCRNHPAVAVSVVKDGKVLLSSGYGFTSALNSTAATKKTIFGLASLSKAFAATLLLKQLHRKNISVDTPLTELLGPDFRFHDNLRTKYATVEDILSHRLGIPGNNLLRFDTNLTRANLPKRLRYLKATRGFRTSFIYSNVMYGLVTHLSERLGGQKWERLVKDELFEPLKMKSSTFTTTADLNSPNVAQATSGGTYNIRVDTEFTKRWGLLCGSGCVMSTADDMAKWMNFHLSLGLSPRGRRVVEADVLAAMYKPQNAFVKRSYKYFTRPDVPVTTSADVYAMGWRRGYYRGYPILTHTGSTFGYRAITMLMPEMKFGVFIAATGRDDNYLTRIPLMNYITDVVLGEKPWLNATTLCSFPKPWFNNTATRDSFPALTPYPRNTSTYEGIYHNKAYGNLNVYYDAREKKIIAKYGYGKWALYPITGPPDTFHGEGIGINSAKNCRVFIFRADKDVVEKITEVEAVCFESRLPPVFVREGYDNSAWSVIGNFLLMAVIMALQTVGVRIFVFC